VLQLERKKVMCLSDYMITFNNVSLNNQPSNHVLQHGYPLQMHRFQKQIKWNDWTEYRTANRT
jgi:hypothetical protein